MSTVYYIVGGFFALQIIFSIIYFIFKKGKDKKANDEIYERLYPVYNNPETVKVAMWINIDTVNGAPFDESIVYYTKLKNGLLNPNNVAVALFKPGIYAFVVSSNSREEYQQIKINQELIAGKTYQLGCDDSGPYFIEDPNPARYELKKAD